MTDFEVIMHVNCPPNVPTLGEKMQRLEKLINDAIDHERYQKNDYFFGYVTITQGKFIE